MSFTFAQVFLAALCFYFVVHSLTCLAEIIHLKRTVGEVPAPLKEKISPAQHRKAASYDIARTKLSWLEVTVSTALIVVLTAGDGINTISDWLMDHVGDQFAFHWMLPAIVGLIFVVVDLPFCWYREFRLREAYGYTRQNPKKWFKNFISLTLLGWIAVLPLLWIGLFLWQETGSHWWLWGWIGFSVYLIFSLGLARRLLYFFRPSRGTAADNPEVLSRLKDLSARTGLTIASVWVASARDNDALPPAFAFGHRQNVRLIFRNDVYKRLSPENLMAIAAHGLARNLSHMYFQAWLASSLSALAVFLFLAWFAPQSWFLNEIGFRVYGPGPYYGSLLTFAIVALPVLLFPFRLPLFLFLRHWIFLSDKYALKHVGLKTTVKALIELTPTPMRHSSVTLGFFDLLFSHEPSLMARITRVQSYQKELQADAQKRLARQERMMKAHQMENIRAAVKQEQREYRFIQSQAKETRRHYDAQRFEKELALAAQTVAINRSHLALKAYADPQLALALQGACRDNASHPLYGKSLAFGLKNAYARVKGRLAAWKASRQNRQEAALAKNSPAEKAPSPVKEELTESVPATEDKARGPGKETTAPERSKAPSAEKPMPDNANTDAQAGQGSLTNLNPTQAHTPSVPLALQAEEDVQPPEAKKKENA